MKCCFLNTDFTLIICLLLFQMEMIRVLVFLEVVPSTHARGCTNFTFSVFIYHFHFSIVKVNPAVVRSPKGTQKVKVPVEQILNFKRKFHLTPYFMRKELFIC